MNTSKNILNNELKNLRDKPDEKIDYSDIPELDEKFWKNVKLVKPINKKKISIRIDEDILRWFKSKGKRYQTLINSVLKTYVDAHKK